MAAAIVKGAQFAVATVDNQHRPRPDHEGQIVAGLAKFGFEPDEQPRLAEDRRQIELERFLTARYCLYATDNAGRLLRGEIHHGDWTLQPAEAEVEKLDMTRQIGLDLPDTDPLLHFSRRLDVVAWLPQRAEP